MDAVSLFLSALQEAGLTPSEAIVGDGKLHRFHDASDKPGHRDGWYVLHLDDVPAGAFGHWRLLPETLRWCSKNEHELTSEERSRVKERLDVIRSLREENRRQFKEKCLQNAKHAWDNAEQAHRNHPYLLRKKVGSYRLKQAEDGALLVPVRDPQGNLQGVQRIWPDGRKEFFPGTNKSGNYHSIGTPKEKTILICEGYATGATLHEATGYAVAVAFDAGNLLPVAANLREKFPTHSLIVCADNDQFKAQNTGVSKGGEAAQTVNGKLCFPEFTDITGNPTDFNDLHVLEGLEAVSNRVAAAIASGVATTVAAKEWDEPLLFGDIETPDIPAETLPTWLGEYAQAVALSTQTPPGLAVMFALAVISTCIQGRFVVAPFDDEYREPVNLWTATALDPGNRKTAVKNLLTAPLTLWEQQQYESLFPSIQETRRRRAINQKRIDKLMERAAKEDSTEERERLFKEIAEIEAATPEEIVAPQLWTDDVTPERLQSLLADHNERMALISDEGGIFEVMAGLYSNGKANLNVFLQAHAGASVRVDRQGRSACLNRPALTFGISVQPDVIAELSSGNKRHFRGNGTLARFLFCLPKSLIGSRNVADRHPIPDGIKRRYEAGVYALLGDSFGESGGEDVQVLSLSEGARDVWVTYSQDIEGKQGANGEYASIQDWTSKLPGAALRVAANLHMVEHGTPLLPISTSTMQRSVELARRLTIHAKAAFRLMGSDPASNDAIRVLRWIQSHNLPSFTRRECHKSLEGTFRNVERLLKALQILEERNIVSAPKEKRAKGNGTGRSSTYYDVNPAVIET